MVDQLEKAEVAEEKRSVFRALTRLRGVALSSFDGVAEAQSANIQEHASALFALGPGISYAVQKKPDSTCLLELQRN
eukprot:g31577.t1